MEHKLIKKNCLQLYLTYFDLYVLYNNFLLYWTDLLIDVKKFKF